MALIEQVKQICTRLAPHGWRELLLHQGLDITATDLEAELAKELQNIDRNIEGFNDFALEGIRGIEPRKPARSLLFHALAAPSVVKNVDGSELTAFPTLAELEIIENYVYGVKPPSLLELRALAQRAPLAIAVFASEYRPAPETVHRKHADMCFSRTGVARVGTAEPLYEPKFRGFLPFVEGNNKAFRVLPARYSAYIAVLNRGNQNLFGPMRFQPEDGQRDFWVPLHKLFSGKECIRDRNLNLTLEAHHVNEKLRRIHLALKEAGWAEPDINKPPFIFTTGIAEWSNNPEFGTELLVPVVHSTLVEPADYEGNPLTFIVPQGSATLSSSLSIPPVNGARHAPEYVHARDKFTLDNQAEPPENQPNNQPNIAEIVANGGYRARHYIDFTGDGWIEPLCPEIAVSIPRRVPAYSLVTAPDFFPNCDQRELMNWWEQSVPTALRQRIWQIPPETLSDERLAPNLQLQQAGFRQEDSSVTAIVSLPHSILAQETQLDVPQTTRHSYLPDAASGVFAPGWDTSFDRTADGVEHLAAYGLGSPFPEDSKLCAALSTFWPAVAPDAARTFEPNPNWPTVSPLTDTEIGQVGNLPWDGVAGPRLIELDGKKVVEYSALDYVDYVKNALQNEFSLSLTGQVDVSEYEARVLAMARVYLALGLNFNARGQWSVLSFQEVLPSDRELQQAQTQTGVTLQGKVYRFQLYRHGLRSPHPKDFRKVVVEIEEIVTLFVAPLRILQQQQNGRWVVSNV